MVDLYIPIATGRMLLSGTVPHDAESHSKMQSLKGKAVGIEHHLFDELWNFGNRKMPAEIVIENEGAHAEN